MCSNQLLYCIFFVMFLNIWVYLYFEGIPSETSSELDGVVYIHELKFWTGFWWEGVSIYVISVHLQAWQLLYVPLLRTNFFVLISAGSFSVLVKIIFTNLSLKSWAALVFSVSVAAKAFMTSKALKKSWKVHSFFPHLYILSELYIVTSRILEQMHTSTLFLIRTRACSLWCLIFRVFVSNYFISNAWHLNLSSSTIAVSPNH